MLAVNKTGASVTQGSEKGRGKGAYAARSQKSTTKSGLRQRGRWEVSGTS